jgi:thioesterase domain-containing protein
MQSSLEQYVLRHIPIADAMGMRVEFASLEHIVLTAPFLNNINHKSTVFGGSLHAIATLACWCLLFVNLNPDDFHIVIASSEISYLAPVCSDFKAECYMPDVQDWKRFQKILQKKGKARLNLKAKIFQGPHLCVVYSGCFVAMRKT